MTTSCSHIRLWSGFMGQHGPLIWDGYLYGLCFVLRNRRGTDRNEHRGKAGEQRTRPSMRRWHTGNNGGYLFYLRSFHQRPNGGTSALRQLTVAWFCRSLRIWLEWVKQVRFQFVVYAQDVREATQVRIPSEQSAVSTFLFSVRQIDRYSTFEHIIEFYKKFTHSKVKMNIQLWRKSSTAEAVQWIKGLFWPNESWWWHGEVEIICK